jgi:membrane fusion protein, adhesin transport system
MSYDDGRRALKEFNNEKTSGSSFLLLIIFTLIGSLLYWAAVTELDKVTRGQGKTISSLKNQMVQSSEAGVILARFVEEGQLVTEGDVIFEIDPIDVKTQIEQLNQRIARLSLKNLRLKYESESKDFLSISQQSDWDIDDLEDEKELFNARREELASSSDILKLKKRKTENELLELAATEATSRETIALISKEIESIEDLVNSGLVPESRLLALQRDKQENEGRVELALISRERVYATLAEIDEQLLSSTKSFISRVLQEKSEVEYELSEAKVVLPSLGSRLSRNTVLAPVDGIINRVNVRSLNAYVQVGEILAELVPLDDNIVVEAQIDPKDIADISIGSQVKISLTAYDPSKFGRLDGVVDKISADAITDQQTGQSYYLTTISLSGGYVLDEQEEIFILPGMVASVDVLSGKRTILDYIWQPIANTKDKALRD